MATPSGSYEEPARSSNQRIASAFRSHFKMLVDVLDPDEAALALYQEKLISKTTLEEAIGSNLPKFKRSYRLVEAVETVLSICDSTTTTHRILVILERNSTSGPDNSVIARIRRQAMSFGGSSEEEMDYTAGSPRSNRPRMIRLDVTRRVSSEFSLLKQRFASLMMVAKRHLKRKDVDISELKERLLISYREEISRERLSAANSLEEVFEDFISPRCTVTNYFLIGSLADELDIPEITEAIEKFEKSEERFNTRLLNEEFAGVVRTELLRHQSSDSDLPRTVIRLKVEWAEHEATLTEFRSLVREVFPGLSRWIDLDVVNRGCVCFTCWAPERLEGALIQMAEEQRQIAIEKKVTLLEVGGTVIFDITTTTTATQEVLTKSKESVLGMTHASTGSISHRTRTSSSQVRQLPTHTEETETQPKEPAVQNSQEETASPSLPDVSKLPQVNVVTSDSSPVELVQDFPWERLLTWSSLALLVLSLLAVYYSGNGEVVCDSPPHLSSSFVNSACLQSLSRWSYYPLFVFLQSIVLLLPQYLWYSYSKWHVQFFFSALQRFNRHPFTAEGECELEAFEAVANLDEQFSKTRELVRLYVMKIVLHLILWTMCSASTLMLFFGHDSRFKCPKSVLPSGHCLSRDDCDILKDSPPFIDCFHPQLQNLGSVWAANCFILFISLASIVYSFGWFFILPIKNLKQTVEFCSNSHLSPKHFMFDNFNIARASDLDFLFQLLDHIDSGLAAAVLDVHVRRHVNVRLRKHFEIFRLMTNIQLNGFLRGEDGSDRAEDVDEKERHFQFRFGSDIDRELRRVYQRIIGDIPPLPTIHKLIYQCLHHTVHPTDRECALEINFGSTEYGPALGRPFKQVVSVCYLSQLRGREVTSSNTQHTLSHARIALPDTIYSQLFKNINFVNSEIFELVWHRIADRDDPEKCTIISFIVVGPIQEKQNCITANMLLDNLYDACCFKRNCFMLTLRPIKIGDHDVTQMFHKFVPVERMFTFDEEKIEKTTSGAVTMQCGSTDSEESTNLVDPVPLECVFEVKLYRFKDYALGHELYSPPMDYDDVFPEYDNAYDNNYN